MDSTFSPLGFVIFGFSISFYAFVVQSQIRDGRRGESSPAFMVPSSTPPPPSRPPTPPPPSPRSSPPTLESPPPPPRHHHHPRRAPPNQLNKHVPKMKRSPPSPLNHRRPGHLPAHQMNAGKKVGLLFVGIAATMQIGMVGFLVFKRRQLLKTEDRYGTCS